MEIDTLSKLESSIETVIDKLELTKMEVEELKSINNQLYAENEKLKKELTSWSNQVNSILGKLNGVANEHLEVDNANS